ncbi:MAG TPA: nucleotide sugar dehydrogenase [Candidatus Paceibacterota bacterium]|nr:nucleotide sugar dehydrogenase [Candidatus Paceibacterota bacterium]
MNSSRTESTGLLQIQDAVQATPITSQKVVVVGLGYVGLPLAILAREHGHRVSGIDISDARRELIKTATIPDLEDHQIDALKKKPLAVAGDFSAVDTADIIVVCVPTPVDGDHNPDLSPVIGACEGIAAHLKRGQLVVLESTVHPGTCEEIMIPILEKVSGLRAGRDFGVAHCPERINPGDKYWSVARIPRVIGAIDKKTLARASEFYRSILDALVYEMGSLREAEAVKVVENSFRDINIAFVNELAMSFTKLNIDVVNVLEGASTKPFGFMMHSPGVGVGGHCIPVDPYYLIRYAHKNGFSHKFLELARSINERMPEFTADLAEKALEENGVAIDGATVAMLGISYKANISDLRESPSFELVHALKAKGAIVRTFDPHTPKEYSNVGSLEEALDGADAVIIATAHREFATLTPDVFKEHGVRAVIDGRNCLPKAQFVSSGLTYHGIGR